MPAFRAEPFSPSLSSSPRKTMYHFARATGHPVIGVGMGEPRARIPGKLLREILRFLSALWLDNCGTPRQFFHI